MFGRIWFRLFSSNSSCFRSLEKDIRRDCLQGSLPKAVTKMRKILGNSVVPSQDCLGTLLHACQTAQNNDYLDEILQVTKKVYAPGSPLITAQISCLCEFGRLEEAWNLYQSSVQMNCIPRKGALLQLLDIHVDRGDISKALELVVRFRQREQSIPATVAMKILELGINDNDKWQDVVWGLLETYQRSPQPFEKDLALKIIEWFQSYWGSCSVAETNIIMNGRCSNCDHQLETGLTAEEHTALLMHSLKCLDSEAHAFEECDREVKEIRAFKQFVTYHGPFGAVMDGMNVSYFNAKRNVGRLVTVSNRVAGITDQPIAVIVRKHFLKKLKPGNSPEDFRIFNATKGIHYFFTQNRVADDVYCVYCALSNPSTLLVTNDLLGDYHYKMPPPLGKVFKKWQRGHQVQLVQQHNRTDLQIPPSYDFAIQWAKDMLFHIPLVTGHWLCGVKKSS